MKKTRKKRRFFRPKKQDIVGYEEILKNLNYAISKNMPVLLIGETGVGKTALIRHLAYTTGNGYRRLNLNGQTTIDEFVGKLLLNQKGTIWHDGVLVDAMRKGYWLLLDEINAALPEILFVMHSLLDDDRFVVLSENKGEIIRPHKNFRIFATMNPSGRYSGTKELNKALLSRFPMILQIDFPQPSEEQKIIQMYSDINKADIQYLVKMANDLREAYKKEEIEYVLSTRDLINCAVLAKDLGIYKAIELTIVNRCEKEDLKAVQTVVKLYFGENVKRKAEEDPLTELEHTKRKTNILLENISKTFIDVERYAEHGLVISKDAKMKSGALPAGDATEIMFQMGTITEDSFQNILNLTNNFKRAITEEMKQNVKKKTIQRNPSSNTIANPFPSPPRTQVNPYAGLASATINPNQTGGTLTEAMIEEMIKKLR